MKGQKQKKEENRYRVEGKMLSYKPSSPFPDPQTFVRIVYAASVDLARVSAMNELENLGKTPWHTEEWEITETFCGATE